MSAAVIRGLAGMGLLCALGAPVAAQPAWPAATLPNTEVHTFRSAINGREYHVAVALPMSYRTAGADTVRYPVLYLLDGGAHLPLMASMFRLTNRSGRTGDVIMVGIGYYPPGTFIPTPKGQTPGRNIDYTPALTDTTKAQWPSDAASFLRVLKEELIPMIERRYRTSRERTLHGHSFGGLFAAYALFEDPDLFDRYAIISPALWWDHESMFTRERAFRARRSALAKDVFLAVGGLEGPSMVGLMWRMTAALCDGRDAGNYRGLRIRAEVVPDEHHNSAVLLGRALETLFPPFDAGPAPDVCASR